LEWDSKFDWKIPQAINQQARPSRLSFCTTLIMCANRPNDCCVVSTVY
jgi:hypothetical protein